MARTNERIGIRGPAGAAGAAGATGATGATGAAGTNGTNGTNGAPGAAGTNGTNGTNGAPGAGFFLAQNIAANGGTAIGSVDTLVYTVPSTPTGAGRALCSGVLGRLKVAPVGSGTVTVTAGTTAGGTDLMAATTFTSASAVGSDFGLETAKLGSTFDPLRGYNARLAAGTTVYVRVALSGAVLSTAPQFQVDVIGYSPVGT